ncbi:Omp28-related outer membrane protein [Prevotella sp. HUN102]|uniref:Omp28-related outer membrane protein n=1 Tax=Prevotella sp. HUN102 TaxID=1392486 RepID=UPI00048B0229|nr:Omp28-related outer membrane protein [Prevotella sp. HUN102]
MKRILLSCAAFALAVMAIAQSSSLKLKEANLSSLKAKSAVNYAPAKSKAAKANLAQNQRYMGNYSSETVAEKGLGFTSAPGELTLATEVHQKILTSYDEGKVIGMRVGLASDGVGAITAKLFTIKIVNGNPEITEVAKQELATTKKGWNDVTFSTPYTIKLKDVDGFMLGYTYTQKQGQTTDCFPISLIKEGTIVETVVNMKGKWYKFGSTEHGNLSVQAIVEKNYPEKDIILHSATFDGYSKAENNKKVTIEISNFGNKPINSYTLVTEIDNKIVKEQQKTGALTGEVRNDVFEFPTTGLNLGEHKIKFYISKVDNQAPTGNTENDAYESKINIYKEAVKRQKHLVEQFTAIGCTWCPLGSKFLQKLEDQRKDLAWIAIHCKMNVDDPMQTEKTVAIQELLNATSFPSASFDRMVIANSLVAGIGFDQKYYEELYKYFSQIFAQEEQQAPAFVNIDLTANEKDNKLAINVKGTGVEGAAELLKNYSLYVYVTEDGIVERQLDNGKWIPDYVHNNVFRDCLTDVKGDNITWSGNNFESKFTYTIPAKYKAENMNVIAFVAPKLGDPSITVNNLVVNQTNKAKVVAATGIENATIGEENEIVAYYNIAGQKFDAPQKGVNIVKYKNGKTQKVIVK